MDKYRHPKKEKQLFAYLMRINKFKQDKQLAAWLYTSTSVISQVRNDRIPLTPRLILRIYDKTNLSIEKIRAMVKEDVK